MGLDGNLYYTVNNPNPDVTLGRVDTKTTYELLESQATPTGASKGRGRGINPMSADPRSRGPPTNQR
jgi:hypothetical protein